MSKAGGRKRRWVWDRNVLVHELDDGAAEGSRDGSELGEDKAVIPSMGTPRGPPAGVGIVTWVFEDGGFAPVAQLTEDRVHSVVCDRRDAPLCVLDEDGEPRWQGHIDR